MRAPAYQTWFTVSHLAQLLAMGDSTVRRKVKEGAFGPPPGEDATHYIIAIDGRDLRISTLAYAYFLATNPYNYTSEIKARNRAELKRKLNAQAE